MLLKVRSSLYSQDRQEKECELPSSSVKISFTCKCLLHTLQTTHFAMKPHSLRFIFIYFLFMVSRLVAESPDDSGVSSSLCLLYKPLYVAVRTSKNGLQCFCLYVCVYHMCAWYPRRLESGIKSLGTGVAVVSYHMDVGSRQEQ